MSVVELLVISVPEVGKNTSYILMAGLCKVISFYHLVYFLSVLGDTLSFSLTGTRLAGDMKLAMLASADDSHVSRAINSGVQSLYAHDVKRSVGKVGEDMQVERNSIIDSQTVELPCQFEDISVWVKPEEAAKWEDGQHTFHCHAICGQSDKTADLPMKWVLPGNTPWQANHGNHSHIHVNATNGSLFLRSVSKSDEGEYTCLVTNGSVTLTAKASLQVLWVPNLTFELTLVYCVAAGLLVVCVFFGSLLLYYENRLEKQIEEKSVYYTHGSLDAGKPTQEQNQPLYRKRDDRPSNRNLSVPIMQTATKTQRKQSSQVGEGNPSQPWWSLPRNNNGEGDTVCEQDQAGPSGQKQAPPNPVSEIVSEELCANPGSSHSRISV